MRFNMPAQIGKRAAHADKIIDHDVLSFWLNCAVELGLSRQTRETIRTRVRNNIHLNHATVHVPVQPLRQFIGKHFGYGIHPVLLISVGTHQDGLMPSQQRGKRVCLQQIKRIAHQIIRSDRIARFGRPIMRMLFNAGFTGVYQHVRKISPRCPWWFHAPNSITTHLTNFLPDTYHV